MALCVPKTRSKMTSTFTGQLILGTDKRNPLFTVYYQEGEDQEQLHVYYGLELLEVVSADRNEPSFKMLLGASRGQAGVPQNRIFLFFVGLVQAFVV